MATEVTLPQLGESVTEGTITAWLVEVGDSVEADQPLFELSSDKIDTEVPAPAAGVLTEIKVQVDETVDVGTVVAVIGGEGEGGGDGQAETGQAETGQAETSQAQDGQAEEAQAEPAGDAAGNEGPQSAGSVAEREDVAAEAGAEAGGSDTATVPDRATEPSHDTGAEEPAAGASGGGGGVYEDTDEASDTRQAVDGEAPSSGGAGALASPLVRRLASERGVDLSSLQGSGEGGRITREDVEGATGDGAAAQPEEQAAPRQEQPAARQGAPSKQPEAEPKAPPQPERRPTPQTGDRTRVEDLSRIRQRIAAKMMESLASSAQLTTVQEADLTRVMQVRAQVKDEFKAREGVSLSPFTFLCRAAVLAIRNHPKVNANADWNAGKVTFHEYVNLGIAVDTDKGLLVPNVKGADDLSLAGLGRAIKEVADKARGKGKLEMSDIEGATFTMTNTGSVGVLIDTPILNYPEVAILGTGAVKKRPVVVTDEAGPAIAIRDMIYLSLTYDHRLIDGADAARFVTSVKEVVETHDWAQEIGYGV